MNKLILFFGCIIFTSNLLATPASDALLTYTKAKDGIQEVRAMIEIINAVLSTSRVVSCSSIPTTGSSDTVSYSNRTDLFGNNNPHEVRFAYETATKNIPTGFPGAGTAYDKRFRVYTSENGGAEELGAIVEISCSRSAGRVVQTFLSNELIEVHWNVDTANQSYIDFKLATSNGATASYALRFRQSSATAFSIVAQSTLATTDLTATQAGVTDNGAGTNNYVLTDDTTFNNVTTDFHSGWDGTSFTFFD